MEGPADEQDLYDQSFIDVPAILDKHKAAAEVCQGKLSFNRLFRQFLLASMRKTEILKNQMQ